MINEIEQAITKLVTPTTCTSQLDEAKPRDSRLTGVRAILQEHGYKIVMQRADKRRDYYRYVIEVGWPEVDPITDMPIKLYGEWVHDWEMGRISRGELDAYIAAYREKFGGEFARGFLGYHSGEGLPKKVGEGWNHITDEVKDHMLSLIRTQVRDADFMRYRGSTHWVAVFTWDWIDVRSLDPDLNVPELSTPPPPKEYPLIVRAAIKAFKPFIDTVPEIGDTASEAEMTFRIVDFDSPSKTRIQVTVELVDDPKHRQVGLMWFLSRPTLANPHHIAAGPFTTGWSWSRRGMRKLGECIVHKEIEVAITRIMRQYDK